MKQPRTLRSRKLRASLFVEADGKCQGCGTDLPPDWHADHVVPYSVTGRTNVHEMQALCPTCNLKKGAKVEGLRRHQAQMVNIAQDIASRRLSETRKVLAYVVPGGGKSLLPIIMTHYLKTAKLIDKLCWVVPRALLGEQAANAFTDPFLLSRFPHSLAVRDTDGNETNPSRGTDGYVTTYQSIVQNPGLHAHEFKRFRYLLVLDEAHHCAEVTRDERPAWTVPVTPLVESCEYLLLQTGSIERSDNRRIAFLDYVEHPENPSRSIVDLDRVDIPIVRYSLRAATEEQALTKIDFVFLDAQGEYAVNGEVRTVESLASVRREDASAALFTALNTEASEQLLGRCADDWELYRAHANGRAKLLVVANRVHNASKQLAYLRRRGIEARIATSDNEREARQNIHWFRGGGAALVTVAMAYEGLDVPPITHIACLTHIRSVPWIEQMIHRGSRYDRQGGAWHEQRCTVYSPDDPFMRETARRIREAQQRGVKPPGKGPPPPRKLSEIEALSSSITRERGEGFTDGRALDYTETERLRRISKQAGMPIFSAPALAEALRLHDLEREQQQHATQVAVASLPDSVTPTARPLTPRQHERLLRTKIQKFCGSVDRHKGDEKGTMNAHVVRAFQKSRTVMTVPELLDVARWCIARDVPDECGPIVSELASLVRQADIKA